MVRALVLLAVMTACAVDVDPNNTRFKCEEQQVCPDGFSCISGYCEPRGTPDATPPPDRPPGTPDAEPAPDRAMLPSCDDTYGDAPGYILCDQTDTTCSFNADTGGGNCGELCPMYGGTCEGALDNENGPGTECISTGVDTCATNRSTEICICSR